MTDLQQTQTVTADYLVSGMTCAHCVASVTEEVSEIAGVNAVSVELQAAGISTVTVTSSEPVDPKDVRGAIAEAGYELVGPR